MNELESRPRKRRGFVSFNHEIEGGSQTPPISNAVSNRTIQWEALPEWMKDNHFIRGGYRRQQDSWSGCFASIFGYVHNETVNIHTHLWGAILFIGLLIWTLFKTMLLHPTVTWYDIGGFAVFLIAAIVCLGLSSFFHLANCHSYPVASSCHLLDYVGILVLIVGSFFPSIYYAFYCDPTLQLLYCASIVLAGTGAAYVVLAPSYKTPEYRWARTSVFLALGFTALIPVAHAVFLYGWFSVYEEMGFYWLLLSGGLYSLGAILYGARIPERFFPGKVDYVGASHQIFHVNVLLAALAHYVSIYTAYNFQHGTNGALCPFPGPGISFP